MSHVGNNGACLHAVINHWRVRKRTKKQNKTNQREKIKQRKVWEMRLRHIDLF